MKAGDSIQVRQWEFLPATPRPVADPPIEPGALVLWVYAHVLEVTPAGALRVEITHPGNLQHGAERFVAPEDARDKAALEALRDGVRDANPQKAEQLRQHYQAQAERLT